MKRDLRPMLATFTPSHSVRARLFRVQVERETEAWPDAPRPWLSVREVHVAKGQQKSNREKKKPKQDKKKVPAASTSPFASAEQRDKSAKSGGQKKK